MSDMEHSLRRHWSGARIVLVSIAWGLLGAAPLILYIQWGPTNGNPIGLGLLALVAMPSSCVGAAVGVIKIVVDSLTHSRP
jgi:hypothetical protein